ncbi:obg family GTPase CgtA [Spizellomyces punctatus DAOM BR117]|uniref:Obg family GTPase CgtA n=1 Tax=Spizellomyces punctatus (strain DAOM BR117) TaxID=645134 RepID=A0A0L0HQR2_SPIPD|nr:obg family GTPase CgtA [Spizellomyces punctatus DAOM BR117]KND03154.1 obg family GTPase CgtA [Spizellomyces punctatus DAOM BR117]|eukprot:XP_016611193.1 obg family GTPase CgtA [Spizellomyces punctatus DAOM BR117]
MRTGAFRQICTCSRTTVSAQLRPLWLLSNLNSRRLQSSSSGESEGSPRFSSESGSISTVDSVVRRSVHRKFLGKGQPFVDFKRVKVTAGKGGDGAITFFKSSRNPFGPPSGGNGGRGGNVFIVASKEITSLNGVQNRYAAPDGGPGQGKQMHGADGKDTEIVVPVGTQVRQFEPHERKDSTTDDAEEGNENDMNAFEDEARSEEDIKIENMELISKFYKFRSGYTPQEDRMQMLLERIPYEQSTTGQFVDFDLTSDGERHLVAQGGKGGQGNPHFLSSEIRGPALAGKGRPGTTLWLELELKTIADAGLVGLPNAGKSTFLAAVSNAHPRIAPYPFTTLNPYVGTIDFPDFWTMTIADIPGLIEGAHRNVGIGHRFLRHVERNRMLVYVIDLAGKAPWRDFEVLMRELEAYKPGLTNKPSLIVANKADMGKIAKDNLEILKCKTNVPIVPISAMERKNITKATDLMRQMVEKIRAESTD